MEFELVNLEHIFRPRVGSYVVATITVTADEVADIHELMQDLSHYAMNKGFPLSRGNVPEETVSKNTFLETSNDKDIDIDDIDFDHITGVPR